MAIEAMPVSAHGDTYHLGFTAGSDPSNSATVAIAIEAMDGEWSEAGKDAFVQALVDAIANMPEVVALGNAVYATKRREQLWRVHPTEAL